MYLPLFESKPLAEKVHVDAGVHIRVKEYTRRELPEAVVSRSAREAALLEHLDGFALAVDVTFQCTSPLFRHALLRE